MFEKVVKRAFEYMFDKNVVSSYDVGNPNRLDEFIYPGNVSDARYKIRFLAATTDYRSAIVRYRGVKYHVNVSPDFTNITVE